MGQQAMRYRSSVEDMLDELEWPSLEDHRVKSSLTFFYKIHSGTVSHDSQYARYMAYSDALKQYRSLQCTVKICLDRVMVRASVSEFDPEPRHTKGVKNGTSGYLAWRPAFKRQTLASLLSKR